MLAKLPELDESWRNFEHTFESMLNNEYELEFRKFDKKLKS